ncbi:MAG: hypothetical protein ABI564_18895, partial [Ideonella sp.]
MTTALAATPSTARRVLSSAGFDKLLLLLALLALWQLLSLMVGHEVLTNPLATVRNLARLMADPSFAGHAR